MNSLSFNLINQPWIPVIDHHGATHEVGLMELFSKASQWKEISDPSPLVTAALYRLCFAILHRVFGPKDLSSWVALWNAGDLDMVQIEGYLAEWKERFDLFHPEYPFYQVAGYTTNKPNLLTKLAHEMATGNNQTLFDHRPEKFGSCFNPSFTARLLVAVQAYGIGFGVSPTTLDGRKRMFNDGTLLKGIIAILQGPTLLDTLKLNLVRYDAEDLPLPATLEDKPAWEQSCPCHSVDRTVNGYLDLLTWQARSISLIPEVDDNGLVCVRNVHYGQGDKLDGESLIEPLTPYRYDEKKGRLPVKLSESRHLWRDSLALLNVFHTERFRPSLPLKQLYDVVSNHQDITTPVSLRVFGLVRDPGNQASMLLWRTEVLPFSLNLLSTEEAVCRLEEAVSGAENLVSILHKCVRKLAQEYLKASATDTPDKDAVTALASSISRTEHFWAGLDEPFKGLLNDIGHQPDAKLKEWFKLLIHSARAAFQLSERAAGTDGRALRARAIASAEFNKQTSAFLTEKEVSHEAR